MKNLKLLFITVIAVSFPFIQLFAISWDQIIAEGEWDQRGNRSVTILPPAAFIGENTVALEFVTVISDLEVIITDIDGTIHYQEIISAETGSRYEIPYEIPEGGYTISMNHPCGFLKGFFTVK